MNGIKLRIMKIAMIVPPWIKIPPIGFGGIEVVVSLLTEQLVKRGHKVTLFSVGSSRTVAKVSSVFKSEMLPTLDKPSSNIINVMATHVLAAYQEIAKGGFDIIHDHTWKEGLLCASFLDIPVLHTLHSPMDSENKKFYGLFIKNKIKNIHFVSISNFQQQCLPDLNYKGNVYNGIRFERYPFSQDKEDYYFYIGRFNPEKAPHLACEIAKQMGINLLLAGKVNEKAEKEYYDQYIQPYLGNRIRYIGEVGQWSRAKMNLLSRGKAYLYPIQWDEPFGITMVEAMACGTPVLTLKKGSTNEVVEHGATGFVEKGMEELKDSLKHLDAIDPAMCRKRVREMFTAEVMSDKYETVYKNIINQ